ncbi:restriction endonuclease subunit S (plasmid) [Lactiplantibacillus plantarum]|uniref:Restriction endonuclease subunit S n=1 Tax=Lactiplantibacillus plantarum TaxID=1590 RepID=A0AAX1KDV0_LACPN|nr:restriction endonuclease subunit S [Lactiplantibacillus plantarum]QQM62595.1 restriction endonuclease subunit S [Lactiplantibacillus plantarum]
METRTVKLGDLSSDLKGQYGINASAVPLRTNLPTYLRITDIDDFGRIKHDGLCSVETDELNKYSLREGDLVFARTGNSTGRNYWYDSHDGSFVFAGFLIRFHFEETEELFPRFLKYYVQSTEYYDWIEGFSTGSTRKNLNARDYGNLPVVLPPKAYQQKVVAILDMIENKILLNQQINKNLLKLGMNIAIRTSNINKSTTCRISDMKDFLTVSDHVANGSFKTLKDNVTIVDKPDYSLFLRNTDLKRNLMGDKRWITKHSYDFLKKSHLYGGEVIISNVGDVGSVHRVPYLDEHMVAGNNVIFIQSADSWITDYLYLYFLSNIGQHALSTITSGSAQQKFNKTDFRAIELPIIPKNFVKKNLTPILKKIDSNRVEEDCLITLRDLLLPRLLSGEIDLSILEEVLKNAK